MGQGSVEREERPDEASRLLDPEGERARGLTSQDRQSFSTVEGEPLRERPNSAKSQSIPARGLQRNPSVHP